MLSVSHSSRPAQNYANRRGSAPPKDKPAPRPAVADRRGNVGAVGGRPSAGRVVAGRNDDRYKRPADRVRVNLGNTLLEFQKIKITSLYRYLC